MGLDSIWAGDHLLLSDAPLLDSTLTLAAAAAVTEHIQIGSAVFLPSLRPLAWAAKQVGTLSQLAGAGRLQLGVGAGAGPEQEYRAVGLRRSERGRRTDTFLQALPELLAGRAIRLDPDAEAVSLLSPAPMPTVWIGGSSPAALHRVTLFGDGWLAAFHTPKELARARNRLRELADQAGRQHPRLGLVTHATIGTARDSLTESGRDAAVQLRPTAGAGTAVGVGQFSSPGSGSARRVRRSWRQSRGTKASTA